MNIRKKKTYGAVIILGLGALLVDRMFFSEPDSADAADAPRARGPSAAALAVADAEAAERRALLVAAPFPRELPEIDPMTAERDALSLSPRVRDLLLGFSGTELDDKGRPIDPDGLGGTFTEAFIRDHQLVAVMTGAGTNVAIVDGECVKIGESVDHCVLFEITGQSASFRCPAGEVQLKMNNPLTGH